MGLVVKPKDLKFFLNNLNYNCDVYTLKVYPNTELDLTKIENKKSSPLKSMKG